MDKTALLKKIRALAERGVGGEAENAEKLLARMMKKYGISEAELDEETRVRHDFTYHGGEEKKILRQVVYKVTGGYTYVYTPGRFRRDTTRTRGNRAGYPRELRGDVCYRGGTGRARRAPPSAARIRPGRYPGKGRFSPHGEAV